MIYIMYVCMYVWDTDIQVHPRDMKRVSRNELLELIIGIYI